MLNILRVAVSTACLGIIVLLLSACSSEHPAVNQSVWTYQPDAIQVDYSAVPQLNVSDNQPHTLLMAVVQTSDLQNIQSYLQTPEGVSLLLEKNNDLAQAQNYYITKVFVNPYDQNRTLNITRMAGMQSVVIVAGYNQLNPMQVVKIFNIPLKRKLFWGEHYPAKIRINVTLGAQGIANADYSEK